MKKNRLVTSSFRKITSTWKRFLSLLCLSLLGVGFFVGIKATSPDMALTLDHYLDTYHVYDIEMVSTLGFTDKDIEELKALNHVDNVVGIKAQDVSFSFENEEKMIHLIGVTNGINQIRLVKGNMPKKENEIVVEQAFMDYYSFQLGDKITLDSPNLKEKEYWIMGIVESPIYFSHDRGTTGLGSGSIDYYMYGLESNFKGKEYTSLALTVTGAESLMTNSNSYVEKIKEAKEEIATIQESALDRRKKELMENMPSMGNYEQLNLGSATWYIWDRNDSSAYRDMIDAIDSLERIGDVFPLVFFVISVLISLVSMTRMIEEDRTEIGTLKALGFTSFQIMMKYVLYAILATLLGAFIGMSIGFIFIPNVIWNIYTQLFTIPNFIWRFHLHYAFIGLGSSLFCICGATVIVALRTLILKPATLMRPRAPKAGKKILLEHLPLLWNHLHFSMKISIRNLFRYKSRILVTIIGIAGSTSLILAGFGLRDSITNVVHNNYSNVFIYDKMINLKNNHYDDLLAMLEEDENVKNVVPVYIKTHTVSYQEEHYDVNLIVPKEENKLDSVIQLNDIHNHNERISLKDGEVVLSHKLARSLHVKVGSTITMQIQNEIYSFPVSAIAENYIHNYIYMTDDTYTSVIGAYDVNTLLVNVKESDPDLDKQILSYPVVGTIINSLETSKVVTDMLSSLDSVIFILIISAALLTFVIMYNLSNINISERKREIATLKVLGFYHREVDAYITRENIVIHVIGILLGLIGGLYLGHYIISTCEPQYIMFIRHINIESYLLSALIATIFAIIVNIITHFHLKQIQMVDSLKNVE